MLERLDDRFRLLSAGVRGVVPRHRSLRALIDWSWAMCTETQRIVWARASVFGSGLEPDAATAVCAGGRVPPDRVVEALDGLVDKSVLIREEPPGVGMRYRLLETIKAYGRERLRAWGQLAETQRRHRDYYRSVADRANRAWFGPGQVASFTRLRWDHDNLRCAMDSAVGGDAALAIATALRSYWVASGTLDEGRCRLDALLSAAPAAAPFRAEAFIVSAWLAVLQTDLAEAEARLAQARALAGTDSAESDFVHGMVALVRGDPEAAATRLRESYERHRAAGDTRGTCYALLSLAMAHSLLRRADAPALFERSLADSDEHGDRWYKSYALAGFAKELWRQGDVGGAVELAQDAIRLKRPFADRVGLALCIELLTWTAADRGEWERAARLLGAVHRMWEPAGGPLFAATGHDERYRNLTRERLGRRAFATAFAEGAAMTVEHAVAYALKERVPGLRRVLTPRESEVAGLVARGRTNKQIAAELVISPRTAEGHIDRILSKLGFSSRAQIAFWTGDRAREH